MEKKDTQLSIVISCIALLVLLGFFAKQAGREKIERQYTTLQNAFEERNGQLIEQLLQTKDPYRRMGTEYLFFDAVFYGEYYTAFYLRMVTNVVTEEELASTGRNDAFMRWVERNRNVLTPTEKGIANHSKLTLAKKLLLMTRAKGSAYSKLKEHMKIKYQPEKPLSTPSSLRKFYRALKKKIRGGEDLV